MDSGKAGEAAPLRKRLHRREVEHGVRFITFSCQRRLPLLKNPKIADLFADSLARARRRHGFELYAWVAMPEHVHLLVRKPDDAPLAPGLASLKQGVAQSVLTRWSRLHAPILDELRAGDGGARFWQAGGGFDRNIRNDSEFSRAVRYIHENPVKRGLVEQPDGWAWSSVRWWMGVRGGEIECDPPRGRGWETWEGFVEPRPQERP